MYIAKVLTGRGFAAEYPEFEGDGYSVANSFYRSFGDAVAEYFSDLVREDSHLICRCRIHAEDHGDTFSVTLILTLRRSGKRITENTITHRWRRWEGRDALLDGK